VHGCTAREVAATPRRALESAPRAGGSSLPIGAWCAWPSLRSNVYIQIIACDERSPRDSSSSLDFRRARTSSCSGRAGRVSCGYWAAGCGALPKQVALRRKLTGAGRGARKPRHVELSRPSHYAQVVRRARCGGRGQARLANITSNLFRPRRQKRLPDVLPRCQRGQRSES
jgi:hypothetical protein